MRMRKKRNLESRLELCESVCAGRLWDYHSEICDDYKHELFDIAGMFGNNNPLQLEIGCGKGGFILKLAKENPQINYIAVEQCPNVLVSAMERVIDAKLSNVRFILGKAEYLAQVIPRGSVTRIYLNFSCPYPKNTYAKHRLTHGRFLKIYREILREDGEIRQKTDNTKLFEFSLNSFCENGFTMRNITFDLHNSGITGNIMTEYEERFTAQGMPIYYLEAFPLKDEPHTINNNIQEA